MYFLKLRLIKYCMLTKRRVILIIVIVALIILVPILTVTRKPKVDAEENELQLITLWQIDGFEGGKGSRAQYLGDKSKKLFKNKNIYVEVVTLSATAAEENIKIGSIPDIISCAPTFNAHMDYVQSRDFYQKTWCYGSYFILSLDKNAQFNDINADNLIVNAGKDNLVGVATALCGVGDAKLAEPTNAYLQLINGKYKYMLGTQRDIFRLITRGCEFSAKQITEFNDLFQNLSILTQDKKMYETCKKFIEYIVSSNNDVSKIGMFSSNSNNLGEGVYAKDLVAWDNVISMSCAEEYMSEIKDAAANKDVNKLKSLLK